jgi:hypothetical protein
MTREERAYNYASKKNPSKFTVGEIAKHYDDGYKDAINKACKWLEDNANNYVTEHLFGCEVDFKEDKMIEDFKKAMEE